jgi:hypothetical protein
MRKSPASYSGRFSSITSPTRSPRAASACSSEERAAISVRRRSSAGLPASSSTRLPSQRVITASCPIGRQPCETTVKTPGPETTAPTAPSLCTASSRISACAPGRPPPAAIPPTSGTRSCASFRLVRNDPAGKVKGSTSSATSPGSSSSGKPATAIPSSVCMAAAWKHSTSAPGSEPAQTASAGPCSSSRTPATTPSATQPSRCRGASSSWTASAAASTSSRCAGERNRNARSTSPRASPRAARAASVAASRAECEVDRPAPIRHASASDSIARPVYAREDASPGTARTTAP